jgi:hypothetical protein
MESGENLYLLLGIGQTCGGFELRTPFPTGGGTCFFQPDLAPGVSMTTGVDYWDVVRASFAVWFDKLSTNYCCREEHET